MRSDPAKDGTESVVSTVELKQGSSEWLQARCGSLGASRVAEALAKTKTGWGASRANLMAELTAERLTGTPAERFQNDAMRWGTENEPAARLAYEFLTNQTVVEVGMFLHPRIPGSHCSPDGLVGEDGLIEAKCPNTATHIATLLSESIDGKYHTQIQWQLSTTGREWCDYISFDPRLPAEMQLFTKRVHRDDRMIAELEREVSIFLAELDQQVAALRAKFLKAAA